MLLAVDPERTTREVGTSQRPPLEFAHLLDLAAAKLRATPLLFLRTLAFLFEVADGTLREAGMVGLWTRRIDGLGRLG